MVGAGIAGLTSAIALARTGAKVRVFEQAPGIAEVGAGLQLGPNSTRILAALGMETTLRAVARAPDSVTLRDGLDGRRLARIRMGEVIERRFGAPYLHIHRADLIDVLAKAATTAGVEISVGMPVDAVDPDGVVGPCRWHSGPVRSGGCRRRRALTHAARCSGRRGPGVFRLCAYRATIEGAFDVEGTTNWLAPGRHIVTYNLREGDAARTNIVAIAETDQAVEPGWSLIADKAELAEAFRRFVPDIRNLVLRCEDVRKWGLFRHPPLARWARDRVVLIGDAAHPMLPFLAQGAGMAIEDGWVLASALTSGATLADGLSRFEAHRMARACRVQEASAQSGEIYHADGVMRLGRNLALRSGHRLAPSWIEQRFDWIYGYDATREVPLPG